MLGHNRIHHAYTVRQGYDFVWHPYTAEEYAAMGPLGRLRHRFEWSWAGAGVVLHPRGVADEDDGRSTRPPAGSKAIRRDRAIVYAFLATFATVLGVIGWSRTGTVLGTALADRPGPGHPVPGLLLRDRLAWSTCTTSSPTSAGGSAASGPSSRARWRAPPSCARRRGMNFFLHWIMIHIPHHVDMRIPMYNLELAADAIKAALPRHGPRRAAALPGLHRQHPPVQALRLRHRHLADLPGSRRPPGGQPGRAGARRAA